MRPSEIAAKKNIPLYVFFELTRHCNLNCGHCYVVKEKRRELSTGEIKRIIDRLKDANSMILNFSGGEIFTRNDTLTVMAHARAKGFAIKFFTNGTLIDRKIASKVAGLKPLRAEVTIFSMDPKVHDSITGVRGALKRSLNAVELLRARGVPLRIKSVLMQQNASGYRQIIKLAEDVGAKYQFNPVIIPRTNTSNSPLRFTIENDALEKLLRDPKLNDNESRHDDYGAKDKDRLPCSAGHNSCAISSYGDVLPCIILPINLGNLRRKSFNDIWHNSRALRKLRSIRLGDLKDCFKCDKLSLCKRCPGSAYLEGDILGRSARACEIANLEHEIKKHTYS